LECSYSSIADHLLRTRAIVRAPVCACVRAWTCARICARRE